MENFARFSLNSTAIVFKLSHKISNKIIPTENCYCMSYLYVVLIYHSSASIEINESHIGLYQLE
jgi:hypothetical protein